MSVAEVKNLSIGEKLQIMEAIWDDLRSRFDGLDVTPEIRTLLDNRRARVQDGESRLLDWDTVKGTIGRA